MDWLKTQFIGLLRIGPALVIFSPMLLIVAYLAGNVPPIDELNKVEGIIIDVETNKSNQILTVRTENDELRLSSQYKCHNKLEGLFITALVEPDSLMRDLYFVWQLETKNEVVYSYNKRKSNSLDQSKRAAKFSLWGTFIGLLILPIWWRFRKEDG